MKVIAYPFAGGNSYSYARLARGHTYEWVTLDPPGHGTRLQQTLESSISGIVSALLEPTLRAVGSDKYFLFGHSMGAYLALAMLDRLVEMGADLPECLILSGANAPHRITHQSHSTLPRSQFFQWLSAMGGISAEVMAEPELMELFEPILRADVAAVESYAGTFMREYSVPVRILLGLHDKIVSPEAHGWEDCFVSSPEIHIFTGGHFFLFDDIAKVQSLIA